MPLSVTSIGNFEQLSPEAQEAGAETVSQSTPKIEKAGGQLILLNQEG